MEVRLMLFGLGLAAVAGQQWRLWRRDRHRAETVSARLAAFTPPTFPPDAPLVSLLVPAWDEAGYLDAHIESFKALRYPRKELILCVGGADSSLAIARAHAAPNIRVLEQRAGEGKQRALARSLPEAAGDIIFLTDADCLLTDAAFEATLAPLLCEGEVATTGGFVPFAAERDLPFVRAQWYVDTYARALSPAYVEGLIGRNAAIRRETLESVGAFDEPVKTGTDYYLAQKLTRAGVKIRFVPESLMPTEYKTAAGDYLRQQSRWLRNILLHGRAFGAGGQVRAALLQCGVGAGMLLWPLTLPLTGAYGLMLWLWLVAYGVGSRWRYLRFGETALNQPHDSGLLGRAPLYFWLDQVMLAYTLLDVARPARRWRW